MDGRPILEEGENCWQIARARRAAFLVDGAAYFSAFRTALEQARESVLIVGWDIDSNMRLLRGEDEVQGPVVLADFLNATVSRRSGLHAHVLVWDFAMIYALERELLPLYRLQWRTHRRFHFRMDDNHPVGASHHQKIVVVDDCLAFVGGLDLTKGRWDTPAHRADESHRVDPQGSSYPPFHDVQLMVEGEVAAALGALVRERWRRATGKTIQPPRDEHPTPWPARIEPDLQNVAVAVARTEAAHQGRPAVREVERLHLDAIAAAQRSIYLENQYLSSAAVARALARRLEEENGPEIVMVLPRRCGGWLEQTTMDVLRARTLGTLREADRHGRLRVYYPQVPGLGEACIHVHAKVMVVDDALARVGSANLSNRSMALDTECDLAVEAAGARSGAEAIAALRNRLLAEHLGVDPEKMAGALAAEGSLIAAVESLRGGERTLENLDGQVPESLDRTVPEAALIDPERPLDPAYLAGHFVPEKEHGSTRRRLLNRLLMVLALVGVAAAWRWTPLGEELEVRALMAWLAGFRDSPLGGVLVVAGFVVGGLATVPVTLMILATVLLFGAVPGFLHALAGVLLSALATYAAGRFLGTRIVRRFGPWRIKRLSRWLGQRGLLAAVSMRMLPVAPFTLVNMVAGATRVRLREFLLGLVLGVTPGMVALAVLAGSVQAVARDPDPAGLAWLGGEVVLIAAAAMALRRWLWRRNEREGMVSAGQD